MPNIEEELLHDAEELMRSPKGPEGIAEQTVKLGEEIWYYAATVIADAEASEEVAGFVVALGALLTDFGGWVVLLVIIVALALLKFIELALITVLGKIWGVGSGAAHMVHLFFSPVDNAEQWVMDRLTATAKGLVRGWLEAIKLSVLYWFPFLQHPTHSTAAPDLTTINAEIAAINHTIRAMQQEIAALNHTTNIAPNITINDVPLEGRVRRLENLTQPITHDIAVLEHEFEMQQAALPQIELKLQSLSASLHDVRAVEVGWAEIQKELDDSIGQLTGEVSHVQTQTQHNTNNLTLLYPLTLLLGGGPNGLRTLRSLEDRPCQCPKFPGMFHGLGDGLALYEFITHG